ncbi:MAG: HEAT repeat domain-containing protein [Isosphaeraceae bacterium]
MSHSESDAERTWDYGMVGADLVAFPICDNQTFFWSTGKLHDNASYWHERNRVRWRLSGHINYFSVSAFRSVPYAKVSRKGVTEGSETMISWLATFSTRAGNVVSTTANSISIRRAEDNHLYTWKIRGDQSILVTQGDSVSNLQIIASTVSPVSGSQLACPRALPTNHIASLLASRERTQRFTGVKLARLVRDGSHRETVGSLAADPEEDVYIRLEGLSYLASVCGISSRASFASFLSSPDQQTQLETVIALGETGTEEAVGMLSELLDSSDLPYFLRSAAAWCLGQIGGDIAITKLVSTFNDVDQKLREDALDRIISIGRSTVPVLLRHLNDPNDDTAAGCAEALRQQSEIYHQIINTLVPMLRDGENQSVWPVWLLGNLPREEVVPRIAEFQDSAPQLHFTLSLLWSFVESWIAHRWELRPGTTISDLEDMDVV